MIDMSAAAVEGRLTEAARLSIRRQHQTDMSSAAVELRLKRVGELRQLCLSLGMARKLSSPQ